MPDASNTATKVYRNILVQICNVSRDMTDLLSFSFTLGGVILNFETLSKRVREWRRPT